MTSVVRVSVFIVDLRDAKGKLEVKPLDLMINHHTNQLFFDGVEVPAENLIGEEGMGFRYIIDSWNAERILVAAEAIGKDFLPGGAPVGVAPSGTGVQVSLLGLAGILVGWEEGIEVNLLGLTFGLDLNRPAIKLPGLGRLGVPDHPAP